MKNILNQLTEIQVAQKPRCVIIKLNAIPDHIKYFEELLDKKIISQEREYYEQHKDTLGDQSDLDHRLLEIFLNDLALKDYIAAIICTPSQYNLKANCSVDNTQNILQFLQYQQSSIRRGTIPNDAECQDLQNFIATIKSQGVGNRPGVQILMQEIQITEDNYKKCEELFIKAAHFVKQSQNNNILPLLVIEFGIFEQNQLTEITKQVFTSLNIHLIEQNVQHELMVLGTNLPQALFNARQNKKVKIHMSGDELGYRVVQILFNSLPPAIGAVYFSLEAAFLQSRVYLNFLNHLEQQKCFSCWPYGVILSPKLFDEMVMSYSLVRRDQAAQITVNQQLKVIQDALSGKYQIDQERQDIQTIQLEKI